MVTSFSPVLMSWLVGDGEGLRSPRSSEEAKSWSQLTYVGKGRLDPRRQVGFLSLLLSALDNSFCLEIPLTLAAVTSSMVFIREGSRKEGDGFNGIQPSGFGGNS